MFEHKTQYGFLVYDPEHREYFQSKNPSSGPRIQTKPISF